MLDSCIETYKASWFNTIVGLQPYMLVRTNIYYATYVMEILSHPAKN